MSNYIENCLKLMAIPKGMKIYDGVGIAGVNNYAADAITFVNSKSKYLEFAREPNNKFDENAIAVIGYSKGLLFSKRRVIGYVPKEVAKIIVDLGLDSQVIPRLERIYVGQKGYIDIEFQILGPKERQKEYKQRREE
jgi:hypothetical protein